MKTLILEDITVELSTPDNSFDIKCPLLLLQVNSNGQVIGKVNLLAYESSRGVWHADKSITLPKENMEFKISTLMEITKIEHQLLGYIELTRTDLGATLGNQYAEIPLVGPEEYPNLILKTRVLEVDNAQGLHSNIVERIKSLIVRELVKKLSLGASASYRDFEQNGNLDSLDRAISQLQSTLDMNDSGLPFALKHLGMFLETRFNQWRSRVDLDDAIKHYKAAVQLLPEDGPDKPYCLNDLGNSLLTRFKHDGHITDLDNAIIHHKAAVSLTPNGHPHLPPYLTDLGSCLWTRFRRLGNSADIDDAIRHQQLAVSLVPDDHPDKSIHSSSLGNSFLARFEHNGRPVDIDNAIAYQQAAVDLTPDGQPEKSSRLVNLGSSFAIRFQQLGNSDDLDKAIAQKEAAVGLTPDGHPDKPHRLGDLGTSLYRRFEHRGDLDDINNAIKLQRFAIDHLSDKDPFKPACMNNLGTSLSDRFQRLGNLVDINDAIKQQQLAVDLTPDGDPNKAMFLSNLGYSIFNRFDRQGHLADIDNAITHQYASVNLTPDGHPKKPMYLDNLGLSLRARFKRFENLADIDSAIAYQRLAVDFTPDGHPYKPGYLNNLGNSLQIRFGRLNDFVDLDNAITTQQAAVNLSPNENPDRSMYLNSLGNAFNIRFNFLRNPTDLNSAITHHEVSVNLMPSDHIDKHEYLNTLGASILDRFEYTGNISDLDSAIARFQAAIEVTPEDHPSRPSHLLNLGNAILDKLNRSMEPAVVDSAISNLSAAALSPIGPPMIRFKATRRWMSIASAVRHKSLLAACECALNLMPLVAWLGLPIQGRHEQLVKIGDTTRDAAAAAISLEQYGKALEWLEQGRSIVWGQILRLRTPVDELRDVNPQLADRFLEVSRLLDQGMGEHGTGPQSAEQAGQHYRALTTEWESIIEQVRSIPDFESFLKPQSSSRLMKAAQNGPVIVLNVTEKRCDALALLPQSEEIIHIPLPEITSQRITGLQDDLKGVLSSNGIRLRAERAAMKMKDFSDEEQCKEVLSELWSGIVKPIIDSLKLSPHPETLPHIWWCATGPLAFLPIHAAGIYDQGTVNSRLSDYAISSYVPTLSALLEPTGLDKGPAFKLLSVIQPSAPGVSHIPSTKLELKKVQSRFIGRDHVVLEGPAGTKARVTKAMEESNWLHLACHGVQKPDEPTKSALILEDGHLTLEKIIKLNLPKAEFAFLSACQTTAGDEKLSEEAVHIAGGMLLAGYRGVVATMWSIQDDLAPEVTDEFYSRILRDGERPDSRRAAEALHFSVQRLREKPGVSLIDWIPFVHLGV